MKIEFKELLPGLNVVMSKSGRTVYVYVHGFKCANFESGFTYIRVR